MIVFHTFILKTSKHIFINSKDLIQKNWEQNTFWLNAQIKMTYYIHKPFFQEQG